jgi:hypothetical protein
MCTFCIEYTPIDINLSLPLREFGDKTQKIFDPKSTSKIGSSEQNNHPTLLFLYKVYIRKNYDAEESILNINANSCSKDVCIHGSISRDLQT